MLSKHESAWETLAFQAILPPQVWVIKRELLWIPFFGWGLAMLSPIAIDRRAGPRALKQMLEQGRERLQRKDSASSIFPEGTRTAPGRDGVVPDRRCVAAAANRCAGRAGSAQCGDGAGLATRSSSMLA